MMTAIRSASADMMSRKVRRGDGVLGCALMREDKRGKKRGGGSDGAPFIGNAIAGWGRPMGSATRR
jgi:hypothetical protein